MKRWAIAVVAGLTLAGCSDDGAAEPIPAECSLPPAMSVIEPRPDVDGVEWRVSMPIGCQSGVSRSPGAGFDVLSSYNDGVQVWRVENMTCGETATFSIENEPGESYTRCP